MKKLHLSLLFTLAVLTANSQKVYFLYIQTESEQPFFVKMNGKIQSSTASGYIILPKLVDSTYSFSIGFPQNKWGEQNFSVAVNKKDHGYLLKNFGEKGWGLFDLQTLAVQMAITGKASIEQKPGTESGDVSAFTEMLAKAANDPSLKERPVLPKAEEKKTEVAVQEVIKKEQPAVTEEPKIESVNPDITKPVAVVEPTIVKTELSAAGAGESKAETKDIAPAKPVETIADPVTKTDPAILPAETKKELSPVTEDVKVEIKEPAINNTDELKTVVSESYKATQVKKWSESSTTEGFGLVFIDDHNNGIKDTIRLVIPNPKPAVNVVKEEPKEEKKFIDITTPTPGKEDISAGGEVTDLRINNCSELATENDFFKLRKKMAAAEDEDNMVGEARKYFKIKCFHTAQLKNLGTLFLTEEGRYKFFDVAYKYVADAGAFASLQSELKNEYYISRFKAMLRN